MISRADSNKMGAIVNYVFQGETLSKDKNIKTIGNRILGLSGRYDYETKKYKPFIED